MKITRITNGRIIDPANNRDEVADLWLADGKISVPQLGSETETLDARGLVVSPGLIDIHVHLREPGQSHKETIATGTRAAAAGGFTSIVAMPNTNRGDDHLDQGQGGPRSVRKCFLHRRDHEGPSW